MISKDSKDLRYGKSFGLVTKQNNLNLHYSNKQKHNLPKNYTSPTELKTFLCAIKSEILEPRNRNATPCNIPPGEVEALRELIRLQREPVIVIKSRDKGGVIIILDFQEYLRGCYEHLISSQSKPGEENKLYYKQVNSLDIAKAVTTIKEVLQEGLDKNIISKEEYLAMDPQDGTHSRLYCNFKIHKEHTINHAPPPRPIISGSGSFWKVSENISIFT